MGICMHSLWSKNLQTPPKLSVIKAWSWRLIYSPLSIVGKKLIILASLNVPASGIQWKNLIIYLLWKLLAKKISSCSSPIIKPFIKQSLRRSTQPKVISLCQQSPKKATINANLLNEDIDSQLVYSQKMKK